MLKKAVVLIVSAVMGAFAAYSAIKCGIAEFYATPTLNTVSGVSTVTVKLDDGFGIADLEARLSAIEGYKGLYPLTAFEGTAVIEGESSSCVFGFESEYIPSDTPPYVIESGRALSAEDRVSGNKINVVAGGAAWDKYAVGDEVTLTVKSQSAEMDVTVAIVGKIKTPFVSAGFSSNIDAFNTCYGTVYFPKSFDRFGGDDVNLVKVAYTGNKIIQEVAAVSEGKQYAVYNDFNPENIALNDQRAAEAGKKTVWLAVAVVCSLVIIGLAFLVAKQKGAVAFVAKCAAVSILFILMLWAFRNSFAFGQLAASRIDMYVLIVLGAFIGTGLIATGITAFTQKNKRDKKGTEDYKDLTE